MTLEKHQLDGIPGFEYRTISVIAFEQRMKAAGYEIIGSGSGTQNRIKIWWTHKQYRRVEAIYSPDKKTVITAYNVDEED
jgi:hypothetical protein